MTIPDHIAALDVGAKRIGVAIAQVDARLASPLITLNATSDNLIDELRALIEQQAIGLLIVGLPRGLDGQETAQTASARGFAARLSVLELPVVMQDEALTSRLAEAELEARGTSYQNGDVDALAATYILQDYLAEHATTGVAA
ncbi:MAG: Holliday junction resolvase RuvX [Candidatus Saccharimonadales bacterium]